MKKKNSIRLLSVVLAVAVIASGSYLAFKRIVGADTESAKMATFKNPTTEEMRTILFDAYISNRDKNEYYPNVVNTLTVIAEDLNSGTLTKIPVDITEKYSFWRNYWEKSSKKTAKSISEADRKNVALAADEATNKQKLKEKAINSVYGIKNNTSLKAEHTIALNSILQKIDAGTITSESQIITDSSDSAYTEFWQSEYARGRTLLNAMSLGIKKTNGQTVNTETGEGLTDSKAFYQYMEKFNKYLVGMALTDKQFSDKALALAAAQLYVTKGGNVPSTITSDYVQSTATNQTKKMLTDAATKIDSGIDTIFNSLGPILWAILTPVSTSTTTSTSEESGTTTTTAATADTLGNTAEDEAYLSAQGNLPEVEAIADYDGSYDKENALDPELQSSRANAASVYQKDLLSQETQAKKQEEAAEATESTTTKSTADTTSVTPQTSFKSLKIAKAEIDEIVRTGSIELLKKYNLNKLSEADRVEAQKYILDALKKMQQTQGTTSSSANMSFTSQKQLYAYIDELASIGGDAAITNLLGFWGGSEASLKTNSALNYDEALKYFMDKVSAVQTAAETAASSNQEETGRSNLRGWSGVGTVGINPKTGNFEYTSRIVKDNKEVGYISFDPTNQTYGACLPYTYKNQKFTLYADPRNGDVYLEYQKTSNGSAIPIIGNNKIGLMNVTVSKNGNIGGQFKYQNRVFGYNSTTQAFEVPISFSKSGKLGFAKVADANDRGTIYIDTKGNVRGSVGVFGSDKDKSQGVLFFDRDGNLSFTYNYRTADALGKDTTTASISIDKDGNISGTVNVGKVLGFSADVFVGVGKGGITGVNVPIGSWMGNAIGIGIGKDGSVSLGGFLPVSGIPIPIALGQDEHGNFGISLPFVGTILTFGSEDRPLMPPAPKLDEDSNISLDYIYVGRHSIKKAGKTVVVYQPTPVKIEKEEKIARAKLIFDAYQSYLKRNPSVEEFTNWYIYGGHMPEGTDKYPWQDTLKAENSKVRLGWLQRNLTGKGNGSVPDGGKSLIEYGFCSWCSNSQWKTAVAKLKFAYGNQKEYKCIKSGKAAEDCPTRPTDIMQYNPLTEEYLDGDTGGTDSNEYKYIKEFLDLIEKMSQEDPGVDEIVDAFIKNHVGYTGSITPTASATASESADGTSVTFPKGFSTYVVPSTLSGVNPVEFTNKGLDLFQYDSTSANKWISTALGDEIEVLRKGVGYYIYNPGTAVTVSIKQSTVVDTSQAKPTLKKGWNLVGNSLGKDMNLGEITHEIVAGESKTLSAMGKENHIYSKIYLIKNGSATTASEAFSVLNPLASDISSQVVSYRKAYWVYVK